MRKLALLVLLVACGDPTGPSAPPGSIVFTGTVAGPGHLVADDVDARRQIECYIDGVEREWRSSNYQAPTAPYCLRAYYEVRRPTLVQPKNMLTIENATAGASYRVILLPAP